MKTFKLLIFSLAGSLCTATLAETIEASGTVCWTGKLETISTGDENRASNWRINWIYTPDPNSEIEPHNGECIGTAAMIDGKPGAGAGYCTHILKDGSFMSRITPTADGGNTGEYFGGTGRYKGVVGGYIGKPQIRQKAPKGMFASCRHNTSKMTLTATQ